MYHADALFYGLAAILEDSFLAVKIDFPFISARGLNNRIAEQDVHQGCLARAVGPYQAVYLTGRYGQIDIAQGWNAVIAFAQMLYLQ